MLPEILTSYFSNPIWLLGLLGLIPLIIFYLIKPEPEEKVMPSMVFFMEKKEGGMIENALRKLRQNFFLLFHIILLTGFTVAMAGPLMPGTGGADSTVIVLDRSASMTPHMDDAKNFVDSNAGRENTLIVVDDNVEIVMERGSSTQLSREISDIEARDLESDMVTGLEFAREYDGDIVIASDFRQTVDDRSIEAVMSDLQADNRRITSMDLRTSNSWGITEMNPGRENTTIEVANFQNTGDEIEVRIGQEREEIYVEGRSSQSLTFTPSVGQTIVELSEDGFTPDNSAYLSIPDQDDYRVGIISDTRNEYMETALDLISFTEPVHLNPPVTSEPDVDIIVLGEVQTLFDGTQSMIENQLSAGTPVIVFAQESLEDSPGFLPGELGNRYETGVEIHEPVRTGIGNTYVYNMTEFDGESLSTPEEAIIYDESRAGDLLFVNIVNEDFQFDFLYPVFWKNSIEMMTDRLKVDEMNIETGERLSGTSIEDYDEDEIRVTEQGFYTVDGNIYAANMFNRDEFEPINVAREFDGREDTSERDNVQNFAVILLLILLGAEILYLRSIGEIL